MGSYVAVAGALAGVIGIMVLMGPTMEGGSFTGAVHKTALDAVDQVLRRVESVQREDDDEQETIVEFGDKDEELDDDEADDGEDGDVGGGQKAMNSLEIAADGVEESPPAEGNAGEAADAEQEDVWSWMDDDQAAERAGQAPTTQAPAAGATTGKPKPMGATRKPPPQKGWSKEKMARKNAEFQNQYTKIARSAKQKEEDAASPGRAGPSCVVDFDWKAARAQERAAQIASERDAFCQAAEGDASAYGPPGIRCVKSEHGCPRCEWCGPRYRIFIYDHASIEQQAGEVLGGNLRRAGHWWWKFKRWSSCPWLLLKDPEGREELDPDYPDPFLTNELPRTLAEKFPDFELVSNPDDADLVLWLLWDFALCLANGTVAKRWYIGKKRYKNSCPVHWHLWSWVQSTPRWQRNNGRDFVILMSDVDGVVSGRRRQYVAWNMEKDTLEGMLTTLTNESMLIGIEDRRRVEHRGQSCVLEVPYYVYLSTEASSKVLLEEERPKLVSFTGSVENMHHTCDYCMNGIHPKALRRKMVDNMDRDCGTDECLINVLDDKVSGHQRNMPFAVHQMGVQRALRDATYCPIPRGDSAATKRFYSALVAGCVPVIISNHLPLPFSPLLHYTNFSIRIREERLMNPHHSLRNFLRVIPRPRLQKLQQTLDCAREALVYSRGCIPPWRMTDSDWQEQTLLEESGNRSRKPCSMASESPRDVNDFLFLTILTVYHERRREDGSMEAKVKCPYS